MSISNLPPELHANIVALSCSKTPLPSESPTPHTLSLVSSYWYSLAKPFRYHSLRVSGGSGITKLLEHLSRLPECERRVRYLSLSDSPQSDGANDEGVRHQRWSDIRQLLALVTPSLFALELRLEDTTYSTALFAFFWDLPCPHLLSLSIRGYYCYPIPLTYQSGTRPQESNFPLLQHLSLDGVPNPSGLLLHGLLGNAFPKLASLEIRGLCGAVSFACELSEAVAERDGGSNTGAQNILPYRLPNTLRSISLVPSTPVPPKKSKRATMLHEQMMDILTPLAKSSAEEERADSNLQIILGN